MKDFSDDSDSKRDNVSPEADSETDKIPRGEYEIKDSGDIIPLDQWSRVDELYKPKDNATPDYEIKTEGEAVIPVEQWSHLEETEKKEKSTGVEKSRKEAPVFSPIAQKDSTDQKRVCPSCGARIAKDDLKCKYCGEIVHQSARKKILL